MSLNLEEFDRLIAKTREHKLDFHLSKDDAQRLIDHCDVRYSMERPFPAEKGPDIELGYFGVLIQIYYTA